MSVDYRDIQSLLGKRFACKQCGREHFVPTRVIESGSGLTERMPELMEKVLERRKLQVLSDDITHGVVGKRIAELLNSGGWQVRETVLAPMQAETVHADEKYLPAIREGAKGCDVVLTVGAGSITDMGKLVAHESKVPCVCYPTAPSMNAYTSGISALLVKGVKTTLNVEPPLAVYVDTALLMQAPLDLIQAGFADYTAKNYANTDWQIASLLSGDYFCPLPAEMASAAEKKFFSRGAELKERNEEVIGYVIDGLVRGGISMVLAGSSSPASGGEHMISHYLDMESHALGREPFAYHGLQVGVGVTVAAAIYERLRKMSAADIAARLSKRGEPGYEGRAKEYHRKNSDIVWKDFKEKIPLLEKLGELLVANWERISGEILPRLAPAQTIRSCLQQAGCPEKFSDISVDKDLARRAILGGRFIRGRVVSLDIADELGILEEIAEEVVG